MASGSKKVIIISLLANAGIALAKLGGALFTGSAALLAEAVHSFSDCGNQLLLLYGGHMGEKPPTPQHPLGRAKEGFFWSFVVALMLFSLGGIFSLYEGFHKLENHGELNHPVVGVIILVIAIVLEGYSFWACYQEVKHQNTYGSLWQWVRKTTSADLLVIFLEDLAALLGLIFALFALSMAWITGNSLWDALGSMAIGVLLIVTAFVLAREIKSLLIGEAPSQDYATIAARLVAQHLPGGKVVRVLALQVGIGRVLLAAKIDPGETALTAKEAIAKVNLIEKAMKAECPEVRWQFMELDDTDD